MNPTSRSRRTSILRSGRAALLASIAAFALGCTNHTAYGSDDAELAQGALSPVEPLLAQLGSAAQGLFYVTEADAPYVPFHLPLDPSVRLDEQTLKTALQFEASPPFVLDLDSGDAFWAEIEAVMREAGYPPEDGAKYRTLDRLMKEAFVTTTVGDGAHPLTGKIFLATPREESSSADALYIFGRLPNGDLLGVKTERVWT